MKIILPHKTQNVRTQIFRARFKRIVCPFEHSLMTLLMDSIPLSPSLTLNENVFESFDFEFT